MKSMTGCGKGSAADELWSVTVELKSVNHRFLDIACRLPKNLSFLETPLRNEIAAHIQRGHVETWLTVTSQKSGTGKVKIDESLAAEYVCAANRLAEQNGLNGSGITPCELMQMPGVLQIEETDFDDENVEALFLKAVRDALSALNQMRNLEGQHLKEDLEVHLGQAEQLRARIAGLAPNVPEEYRKRLTARLQEMETESADPARIAQEVAIMADRCAIDEELARLNSHFHQMHVYLNATGEIGKKMDFLIQEMNREANTIASKSGNAEIAQCVVDLKSEIEKLREQIQNVE